MASIGCLPADRCARTHCGVLIVSYALPRYVVDAGFCKLKCYNPKIGMDSLLVTPISQVWFTRPAGPAAYTVVAAEDDQLSIGQHRIAAGSLGGAR